MRAMVVIGVIAMIVAAACGSSPPDPAAVYQDMGTRMASATSYHLSVIIEEEGDSSQLLEVDFLAPDRIRITSAGEWWVAEMLSIGDQAYIRLPGFQGWFVEDEGTEGFVDLAAFFSALYTQATGLTYVGQETLEGTSVHHVRGALSGDVLRIVEPDDDDSATVDFWVKVDDHFLYRVRMEESPSGEVTEMAFSTFDAPVTIEAPAKAVSADVFDGLERGEVAPDVLGELISILPLDAQACLRDHLGEGAYNTLAAGLGSIGFEEGVVFEQCMADTFSN